MFMIPTHLSVPEFISLTSEDMDSPTTSSFFEKMPKCRDTVTYLEENLDFDRSGLNRTKKAVKALYNSGTSQSMNEDYLAKNFTRLANNAMSKEQEPEIGAAFMKFAVVTKELSDLMKNLMQNLNNIVMFPMESFLKGDSRDVKGDLKKPFDKAWKDYFTKYGKIEKEKKQLAEKHGCHRTEISGAEIAEEMEKERRMFQLQMCEYLIKVNEFKTRKGVELLQHLVEYYKAQTNFFTDGMKVVNHFTSYIDDLCSNIHKTKQRQDLERRNLVDLRDSLKNVLAVYKEHSCFRGLISGVTSDHETLPTSKEMGYNLHQLSGNKVHGCEKQGYLSKRSENMLKKVWLRRKVMIKDGIMFISRSDSSKEPVKLNLLTCSAKVATDDPTKRCFDLMSGSQIRTYRFQAEDMKELEEWLSVLHNAKEAVLMKAFTDSPEDNTVNQSVKELTRSIIGEVKKLPGNRYCCDCSAPEPEWLSTNLGVLVCLECCGIHREMGVHISRMQSIVIDDLGTSQLLLARVIGNASFNEIMEATLSPAQKITPSQQISQERKDFIRDKYEKHHFAIKIYTSSEAIRQDLKQAILSKDILSLLQVFSEGANLMCPLPDMPNNETALHLAIQQEDGTSLHMVDFIIQNSMSNDLERTTKLGDTALHICAKYNRTECMKLLLRTKMHIVTLQNGNGQTALDIATEYGFDTCIELLKHAINHKTDMFHHVNIDWDLIQEDHIYDPVDGLDGVDFSDDELDERPAPRLGEFKVRSRPSSAIDIGVNLYLPPPPGTKPSDQMDGRGFGFGTSPKGQPPPPPPHKPKVFYRHSLCLSVPNLIIPNNGTVAPPPVPTKKKPAPLPPGPKTPTAPTHRRTPSEPPPLPAKSFPSGAKLVLPPTVPTSQSEQSDSALKPKPFPRHTRSSSDQVDSVKTFINNEPLKSPGSLSSNDFAGRGNPPVPVRRQKKSSGSEPGGVQRRRCRALYPCVADKRDELTFQEGEIILVLREEDETWWEGEIAGQPDRRGMFPVSFVHILIPGDKYIDSYS
ncbi:arf-GAP with SH3 domain, ANK repeat and PH domain-containing protein 2-like isoform X4 [Lineus longissimus]|uniref:arf-GAP with SH3 domain, ANK repeat and PH domain-containing protein 2-like isoform X4 n=1 Tax=Lineus longissimus TaxID=88925 RepID=UPI00315DCD90